TVQAQDPAPNQKHASLAARRIKPEMTDIPIGFLGVTAPRYSVPSSSRDLCYAQYEIIASIFGMKNLSKKAFVPKRLTSNALGEFAPSTRRPQPCHLILLQPAIERTPGNRKPEGSDDHSRGHRLADGPLSLGKTGDRVIARG